MRPTVSEPVIGEPVDQSGQPFGYARRFQELVAYRKARALAREVFDASKLFPAAEAFSLTDQLRRSSRSIGAQIAEAWAKRRYPRHFMSKLTDADGEQQETQHWLTTAFDCGYLSSEETRRLGGLCLEVGRLLGSMIAKAGSFCQPDPDQLHEEAPAYRISEETEADSPTFLTDH